MCRVAGEWDRPILLEKTPTHAVTSRYVQALLRMHIDAGVTSPPPRFVFMVRQPLAYALAHKRFVSPRATMVRPSPHARTLSFDLL